MAQASCILPLKLPYSMSLATLDTPQKINYHLIMVSINEAYPCYSQEEGIIFLSFSLLFINLQLKQLKHENQFS